MINIQLLNTGSELMLGRVLNTHQQWICRLLADHGYVVARQVAVDDSALAIRDAVKDALATADLVITTGGLGPTSDDRTRDLVAELLGLKLHEDAAVLANIERFFTARHRSMPANVKVQALVPEGAVVLPNAHGTAPGLVIPARRSPDRMPVPPAGQRPSRMEVRGPLIIMLPGPPRELRPMFREQVMPVIEKEFPLASPLVCRTLRTTGLGESVVEERIAGPLRPLLEAGLELAYCGRPAEVDLRFAAFGADAAHRVAEAERIVRSLIGEYIFGMEDDPLEAVLVRLLTERRQTLALAESCTGGLIAHRITNVSGASAVLLGGIVSYGNDIKEKFLGVRADTLAQHGAVSEPTAVEMASGARARTGADYALSVTGIAGPSGGSEAKPVGTVFIGLSSARGVKAKHFLNPYDRETFKWVTSQQALDMLRRELLHEFH